jgi:hypothetical protein
VPVRTQNGLQWPEHIRNDDAVQWQLHQRQRQQHESTGEDRMRTQNMMSMMSATARRMSAERKMACAREGQPTQSEVAEAAW